MAACLWADMHRVRVLYIIWSEPSRSLFWAFEVSLYVSQRFQSSRVVSLLSTKWTKPLSVRVALENWRLVVKQCYALSSDVGIGGLNTGQSNFRTHLLSSHWISSGFELSSRVGCSCDFVVLEFCSLSCNASRLRAREVDVDVVSCVCFHRFIQSLRMF